MGDTPEPSCRVVGSGDGERSRPDRIGLSNAGMEEAEQSREIEVLHLSQMET